MINYHALRLTSKPFGSLTANSYYETKTVSRYVSVMLLYVYEKVSEAQEN